LSAIPVPSRDNESDVTNVGELVRIGTMVGALLEEVRAITMDDAGRTRLAAVHERAVEAVRHSVSEELENELTELDMSVGPDASEAELRLAQAQLIGWLNGVLLGLRAVASQGQVPQAPVAPALGPSRGNGGYA
jgi:hypothetical protein